MHSQPSTPRSFAALISLDDEPSPASGVAAKHPSAVEAFPEPPGPCDRIEPLPCGGVAGDDMAHVGLTLAGRYRIEQLLGEGAMGLVVAARHLSGDGRVAIKFIRRELRQDTLAVSRFAREANALARLRSAHVARLLDEGVSLSIGPYFVMEYLEGRDLGQVLGSEGSLELSRAVDYVLQACEALTVAHAAGITHQDIKPENLFLARHGDAEAVKVLDFGISKAMPGGHAFGPQLPALRAPAALMGTPQYMSPERVRNDPNVDQRSDIWSLGVVLYELVTGHTLFEGDSVTEICSRILEDSPLPLAVTGGAARRQLDAIITRCLCRDPEGRFQDVASLAEALRPLAPHLNGAFEQKSGAAARNQARAEWQVSPLTNEAAKVEASAPPPRLRSERRQTNVRGAEKNAAPPWLRRAAPALLTLVFASVAVVSIGKSSDRVDAAAIAPLSSDHAAQPIAGGDLVPASPAIAAIAAPTPALEERSPAAPRPPSEDHQALSISPSSRSKAIRAAAPRASAIAVGRAGAPRPATQRSVRSAAPKPRQSAAPRTARPTDKRAAGRARLLENGSRPRLVESKPRRRPRLVD